MAEKNEVLYTQEELSKHGLTIPKNISDQVFNTLQLHQDNGRLSLPKNYDLGNALTSAYLIIAQDPKLNVCSKESIIQSMIDMGTMGLNPSKKQCYFVPMGGKCNIMVSYFGKQTALKRIKGIKDIVSDVIYQDTDYALGTDDFGLETIKIVKPCPLDKRKGENIIGAWAKILMDEDVWGRNEYTCIMTREDIENAHKMGNGGGKTKAHTNFFGEMAKKSVINRCVKNFVNSKSDDDLLIESLNNVVDNEYKEEETQQKYYEETRVDANNVFDTIVEEKKEKESVKEVVEVEVVEPKKSEAFDIDVDF